MRRRGGRPFTSRNLAGILVIERGEVQAVEPLSAGSVSLIDAFGQCSSVGETNGKVIKGIFGSSGAIASIRVLALVIVLLFPPCFLDCFRIPPY